MARHWIGVGGLFRAALELGMGWDWQQVGGEAGCP